MTEYRAVQLDISCHYSYEVDEDGSTIIVTEEINVLDLMALYKERLFAQYLCSKRIL